MEMESPFPRSIQTTIPLLVNVVGGRHTQIGE